MNKWFVYILECNDGSLYTGVTNDLNRRIKQHNAGKGAKYTRMKRPVKLVYSKEIENKSEAFKMEYQIKQLSKKEKISLIQNES